MIRIKGRKYFPYILSALCILGLILIFGERKAAIVIIIPLLVYDLVTKNIKLKKLLILCLLFLALDLWGIIRSSSNKSISSMVDIRRSLLSGYLGVYSHLEPLGAIIDLGLYKDYYYKELANNYLIYNVPRFLYPEKPLVMGGQAIITPLVAIPEANLSAVPTGVGEGLLAAGFWGIIIYACLHALLIFSIYELLYKRSYDQIDYFVLYGYFLYIIQGIHRSGIFGFVAELGVIAMLIIIIEAKSITSHLYKRKAKIG